MLVAAFWLLSATVALGLGAALGLAKGWTGRRLGWLPGALHGLAGLSGAALLLASLGGPARGLQLGMGQFGLVAAAMVGVGLLIGLGLLARNLAGRPAPVLVVGLHATIAIMGYVVLVAYLAAPPG